MKKTFFWTSNKFDTIHTLKIYEGSKLVCSVPKLDGKALQEMVAELKANGYTFKVH